MYHNNKINKLIRNQINLNYTKGTNIRLKVIIKKFNKTTKILM